MQCPTCGAVWVPAAATVVHHHRASGFQLLQAHCPNCAETLVSADEILLDRAIGTGASVQELLTPGTPLCDADLESFRAALADDDWCAQLAGGDAPDDPASPKPGAAGG